MNANQLNELKSRSYDRIMEALHRYKLGEMKDCDLILTVKTEEELVKSIENPIKKD